MMDCGQHINHPRHRDQHHRVNRYRRSAFESANAFTLVEVLVVVVIIGVLAAIAVPSMQQAKMHAKPRPGQLAVRHEDTFAGNNVPLVDPVNGTQMTTDVAHAFQQSLESRLAPATAVFNSPTEMALAETKTIKLVISMSKSESQLVPQVQEFGESKAASIKVGSLMQAILVSNDQDGLSVVANTTNPQDLFRTEDTYWEWHVTAKKPGKYKLSLTIEIESDINGVRLQRAVKTYEEDIVVDVSTWKTIKEFFTSNWQWLWTALVIPIAGYIWKRWKAKKKKAKTKPVNEHENDG